VTDEWEIKRDVVYKFLADLSPGELADVMTDVRSLLRYKINLAKTMLHETRKEEFQKIMERNFDEKA